MLAQNFLERFMDMHTETPASNSDRPSEEVVSTEALRKAVVSLGKPKTVAFLKENNQSEDGCGGEGGDFPREIDQTIFQISKTGKVYCGWMVLREAMAHKSRRCVASFATAPGEQQVVNPDDFAEYFSKRLEQFPGPPFTIQRLCELLNEAKRHTTNVKKFMGAVDRCLSVTNTVPSGISATAAHPGAANGKDETMADATILSPAKTPAKSIKNSQGSEARKRRIDEIDSV